MFLVNNTVLYPQIYLSEKIIYYSFKKNHRSSGSFSGPHAMFLNLKIKIINKVPTVTDLGFQQLLQDVPKH